MLNEADSESLQSRFKVNPTDASYDFDTYVFFRNTEDPTARFANDDVRPSERLPSDPRFQRFVNAAENGIALFLDHARLPFGNAPEVGVLASALQDTLLSWWFAVCAVRAFNQLGRYSRSDILGSSTYWSSNTPEGVYGEALSWVLINTGTTEAQAFLANNGDSSALVTLTTFGFWEDVLTRVFEDYFEAVGIKPVDPTSPKGEYVFEPFPIDEVLFGLRVVHRQTWHLLGYARGELVKSIPLGPKETQKVSLKITRRSKVARTNETAATYETTSDSTTTTKETSDVVNEASSKHNEHLDAEAGGGFLSFFQAKVSGGYSDESAFGSKLTNGRLNEVMQKTASRMKRDTKVTVSTESEETFEETRASELTNPNDEIAITYLYHRLQQRYSVSSEIGEVQSVVFIPEPLPEWDDINEDWIRQHGGILAASLLDQSFGPTLAAIRAEPGNLAYTPGTLFGNAAQAGVRAAQNVTNFTGGYMPDLLASGQQFYERDFERRNNLAMDQARRQHQSEALIAHIRRNILHYMRAAWMSEDHDQRMQRYSRIRVPTAWYFVPSAPGSSNASALEVEGVFRPDASSTRPLTEVIDPIGPIGYLFNCAIYRLRDDPRLLNMHQALSYLRAGYTHFAVTVESSGAGVSVRQAVAYAPRSSKAAYTLVYRQARAKWLVEIAGRNEMDWLEVTEVEEGCLDAMGIRVWLDGKPANNDKLTIEVRATGQVEDPHLRLVSMLHPLPTAAEEPQVFTPDVLQEMVALVVPELASDIDSLSWDELSDAQQDVFRSQYHRFMMIQESGRLVPLDTANVVLDLEISQTPALEQFKRLHRYVDVLKEYEELRRRAFENSRRDGLLKKGVLGDPDIERVTFVATREDLKNVIVAPAEPDDE